MSLQVTLAWDPLDVTATGCNLYVGPASGQYTTVGSPKPFGVVTTGTFDVPVAGTYYYALKAFNGLGQESAFSNEVSGPSVSYQAGAMTPAGQYRIRYR